jgi:hypothetical protein
VGPSRKGDGTRSGALPPDCQWSGVQPDGNRSASHHATFAWRNDFDGELCGYLQKLSRQAAQPSLSKQVVIMNLSTLLQQPMALILLIGLLFLFYVMFRIQRSKNRVDLYYLILDEKTQQPSLHKFGQLVALAVSTWVLVDEEMHGRMTEWLFTAYMGAWAVTTIANNYLTRDKASDPLPPQ